MSTSAFFESLARPVEHVVVAAGDPVPADVVRASSGKVTGSLVFLGSTAHSRLIADLALELAPVRVNLVAHQSVVDPTDVAAPAVRLMIDAAITGATVDVDGGRRLVE